MGGTIQETGMWPIENKQNFLLGYIWAGLFFSLKTKLEEPVLLCHVKVQFKCYSLISQSIKNTAKYCK